MPLRSRCRTTADGWVRRSAARRSLLVGPLFDFCLAEEDSGPWPHGFGGREHDGTVIIEPFRACPLVASGSWRAVDGGGGVFGERVRGWRLGLDRSRAPNAGWRREGRSRTNSGAARGQLRS